jgi:hypothetical protein
MGSDTGGRVEARGESRGKRAVAREDEEVPRAEKTTKKLLQRNLLMVGVAGEVGDLPMHIRRVGWTELSAPAPQ